MADTKLSALTAKTTAADADLFYLVDSATSPITSKGITYANLEARLRDATIITDLAEVTAASADYLLILDVSASPQALKKVLVSDLLDNATHTGDVTGSGALTIQPEAISGKGAVTASGSDYVLILDTSTSPHSLAKALVSDLGSAFGVSDITGAGAVTVAAGDLLVAVDISASPQVLGQVTAQSVADLFDASGYLPLSGGTMTGSIAVADTSPRLTIYGRDLAADGTKLDGIEALADVTDLANVQTALVSSSAVTVDAADVVYVLDVSASPQVIGETTAQAIANLAPAVQGSAILSSDTSPLVTDGYVLTADGAGGAAWEAAAGGVDWTSTQTNNLTAATGNEVAFDFSSTVNKATSGNYTGIKLDVTETSAPGSTDILLDLQVGGSTKARILNDGVFELNGGTLGGGGSVLSSGGSLFLNASSGANPVILRSNTSKILSAELTTGIIASAATPFGFGSSSTNSPDAYLYRDAAATIAQRNSTNAQTFRVYNTYTDASNYERLAITGSAITVETAGTGTDDIDLTLAPAGAGNVRFGTHSAIGAETVTGYITIKDAGGTSRKLAVVS